MGRRYLLALFIIIQVVVSCKQDETPDLSLAPLPRTSVGEESDPRAFRARVLGLQAEFDSYSSRLPLKKEYVEGEILWEQTKMQNKGDTAVYEISFKETKSLKRTMTVRDINGINIFTIKVENLGALDNSKKPSTEYIHFPTHVVDIAGGRAMADGGGSICGKCHDFAWWDTFDEVTIVGTAPVDNYPFIPNNWGGQQVYVVSPSPIVYDMYAVDLFSRDCFSKIFDQMRKGRFDNKVQQILTNFEEAKDFSFTINDAFMASQYLNATTSITASGPMITLNVNALEHSSQEFIAKVIYHEVLHVFLNGATNQGDHNVMASKYVEPMAQALMSWFSITPTDARGLAWAGLKDTPAWNGLSAAERASYTGIGDRYKNLNNAYNHQYGHYCP